MTDKYSIEDIEAALERLKIPIGSHYTEKLITELQRPKQMFRDGTENIKQAFMLLDKWQAQDEEFLYEIKGAFPSGKRRVRLSGHLGTHGGVTEIYDDSLKTAISLAVAKATGWEE